MGDDPDRCSERGEARVDDETIRHAFNNPIHAYDLDDGFTMLVGPDRAGNLYEIGVVDSEDGPVVVHAMEARSRFLR